MTDPEFAPAWHRIVGKLKREEWGKLTEEDLKQLEEQVEQFEAELHERYGFARAEAGRQTKETRKQRNWS